MLLLLLLLLLSVCHQIQEQYWKHYSIKSNILTLIHQVQTTMLGMKLSKLININNLYVMTSC